MGALLVGALIFVAVTSIGGALLAVRAARRQTIRQRLSQPGEAALAGVGGLAQAIGVRTLSRLGLALSGRAPSQALAERLCRAGYYAKSAPAIYMGAKMLLLLVGTGGAAVLMFSLHLPLAVQGAVVAFAGAIFFFVPNIIVESRQAARRRDIQLSFPDAVDLLEVCVSAGMGLDMAWNLVGEEIAHVNRVLAEEMVLTDLEVHLGAKRVTALHHLAERTGVDEIQSLTAMLVQSERFGTSIAEALKTFAVSMRESRGARAQERAEKTAVKLILPMVLFVFPAMLVVLVGPAFLRLFEMMSKH